MPTTAEIGKLQGHVIKAKGLLNRTAIAAEKAGPVLAEYEENLGAFEGHMATVSRNSADLKALMAEMGNTSEAIKDAFQGDEKKVETRPAEGAHLHEVKTG